MKKLLLALSITCLPFSAFALPNTVSYAGTYGNGDVFIGFKSPVTGEVTSCSTSRIDLPYNFPGLEKIYATALTALSTGTQVDVRVAGGQCYNGYQTLSKDNQSFLYLAPFE